MRMLAPSIHFVSTPSCNLACRYCDVEAGPTRPSPDKAKIVQTLANLFPQINRLEISGGEPLHDWENTRLLLSTLRDLKEDKKVSTKSIVMASNGLEFYRDPSEELIDKLRQLDLFGVEQVKFFNFRYHLAQQLFPDIATNEQSYRKALETYIDRIKTTIISLGLSYSTDTNLGFSWKKGNDNGSLFKASLKILLPTVAKQFTDFAPLGRGKDTPQQFRSAYCQTQKTLQSRLDSARTWGTPPSAFPLTIDFNGDVFICEYRRIKIGNILDAPMREVLTSAYETGGHFKGYHDFYWSLVFQENGLPESIPELSCGICGML